MSEMYDSEGDAGCFAFMLFAFWWFVLLCSPYWWIAVLIAVVALTAYLIAVAWELYKESEQYRYQQARKRAQRLDRQFNNLLDELRRRTRRRD